VVRLENQLAEKLGSFQEEITASRRGALKEKGKDGGFHGGRKILKLVAKFYRCAGTRNARC